MERMNEVKEAVLNTIVRTIEKYRKEWPAAFALSRIGELTGGGFAPKSLHNRRSRHELPDRIFFKNGEHRVMVARDPFLDWWQSELTTAERAR